MIVARISGELYHLTKCRWDIVKAGQFTNANRANSDNGKVE